MPSVRPSVRSTTSPTRADSASHATCIWRSGAGATAGPTCAGRHSTPSPETAGTSRVVRRVASRVVVGPFARPAVPDRPHPTVAEIATTTASVARRVRGPPRRRLVDGSAAMSQNDGRLPARIEFAWDRASKRRRPGSSVPNAMAPPRSAHAAAASLRPRARAMAAPMSGRLAATLTPAASTLAILLSAVSSPPLMIAPAWPNRRPGRHGRGTSRSWQIFRASMSSMMSECLGMAVRRPLAGLPHHECRAPSRTSSHPCDCKWAIRSRRFTM